ncbi:hypothetical protein [uncultured Tateyamaria sp.]|uniref:hypothetical protein n=1 Tax=Tateyamaria sp. TaxID=1929288 RepID=UPI00262EA8BD|nr:hypothetical protein [uncultured Tateyamaria sp.]
MDIDIEEMTGEALSLDVQGFKAEIVAEVVQKLTEARRLGARLDEERALRSTARNRSRDLV